MQRDDNWRLNTTRISASMRTKKQKKTRKNWPR